jgi:hypothetical protein
MKNFGQVLLTLVIAMLNHSSANASENINKEAAMAEIHQAYLNASASEQVQLKQISKAAVEALNSVPTKKFVSTSEADQTTALLCLYGGIALAAKGAAGTCVDGSRNVYIMYMSGVGLSAGTKGALVAGIVKGTGDIKGTYSGGAVALINYPLILKALKMKIGVGPDFAMGFKENANGQTDDNSAVLILGGAGVGAMVDFSKDSITLK